MPRRKKMFGVWGFIWANKHLKPSHWTLRKYAFFFNGTWWNSIWICDQMRFYSTTLFFFCPLIWSKHNRHFEVGITRHPMIWYNHNTSHMILYYCNLFFTFCDMLSIANTYISTWGYVSSLNYAFKVKLRQYLLQAAKWHYMHTNTVSKHIHIHVCWYKTDSVFNQFDINLQLNEV